jgi:hypothetical protein
VNTRPLVNDLKGPADNLGPTVRDLGDLSPDAERLFRNLPPLINASATGLPATQRILKGAEPLFEAAHVFLPELNPILSFLNFRQATVAGFLTNATADLSGKGSGRRKQTQIGVVDARSFQKFTTRPYWERGNSYIAPNALQHAIALGGIESFDCKAAGGEQPDPVDTPPPGRDKTPPCFVAPPSLYDGKQFSLLRKGHAPKVNAPTFREGKNGTAKDPHPNDPLR